ncbi:peroxiredoxin-5, mitochondrial isoform X2 [Nomascus leucogenys]|uniref:peroxiredoxin-5, mitochondrial isoform X2 n=1 Tax=Nomascus leucogenys TaxID=61853 RepID=UPI00122D7E2C|nr:peroxiredoxin-5, mitochondrial isoform X2 [Nomascus leucogenys]XP_055096416.1 peroxiredoxin-5, mitochondrial isoform X3 [Symphalangus syndactylus]
MGLAGVCTLRRSAGYILVGGAAGQSVAAAAAARRWSERGWASGGVRSFSRAAAAMAPIKTHLPGFVEQAEALKAKGVQVVACLSVNDAFVTGEWGRAHKAEGKVRLLADPTGAFGKETDLLLDDSLVSIFGNRRLKRFSMVVQDGIVKSLNVEPDGTGLTCSLAPNIISQL